MAVKKRMDQIRNIIQKPKLHLRLEFRRYNMDANLIQAYKNTIYQVDGIDQPIKIGNPNPALDAFCIKNGAQRWAFITAWNPLSVTLSVEENQKRNQKLLVEIANYTVLTGRGQDPDGIWPAEESFFILGIKLLDSITLGRKYGQRAIVVGAVGADAKLIETLDFTGNNHLLLESKTTFLCSRKVPALVALKCYDWAIEQREKGNCVISGFHSQLEQDVLHYLLKGQQPIILVLAGGLKEGIDPAFEKAVAQGRLLIITPFDKTVKRISSQTAQIRNQLMITLADQITVGYVSPGGQLEDLLKETGKQINKIM